ncbi:MAG: hypothetical protein WCR36_11575 [Bacteroidaceae bacterium]
MKINPLKQIGIVPVTTQVIASLSPYIKAKAKKVYDLEKTDEIIRLKKGLYVVNPELTGMTLSTELIANHIYGPSYISMQSALRYYGLIPETVYAMQSMTIKNSRNFDTPLGRFQYAKISREAFPIGIKQVKQNDVVFIMATPEKALCDLIANSPKVTLRYFKEAQQYLEEDIRMDMNAFKEMNQNIFREYIRVGKKANSIKTILKLLER